MLVTNTVDGNAVRVAKDMIPLWQPARSLVIDMAHILEGYKIVEFNNINAAGFYACDVSKIVNALEPMEPE